MKRRVAKKRYHRHWRTQRIQWKRYRGYAEIWVRQFCDELVARLEENERQYWKERNARIIPNDAAIADAMKFKEELREWLRIDHVAGTPEITFTVREV